MDGVDATYEHAGGDLRRIGFKRHSEVVHAVRCGRLMPRYAVVSLH